MRKLLLIVLLYCLSIAYAGAQELIVQSFVKKTTDLEAKVRPVYDNNGDACALIKVAMRGENIVFEGNVVGKPENRQGEYFVYMAAGSRRLKIKSDNYLPLSVEFSDFKIKLEKNITYELRIVVLAQDEGQLSDGSDKKKEQNEKELQNKVDEIKKRLWNNR